MKIPNFWQPTLRGPTLSIRPLAEMDFEPLFAAASDPLIWEQHPDQARHTRDKFTVYFRSGVESGGAFVVTDNQTEQIIGSSRFTDFDEERSAVDVGYTFLTRAHWGGTKNFELKTLMLDYAFQKVEVVYFVVGRHNMRSRKAMEKIGAKYETSHIDESVVFIIHKGEWQTST